MNFRLDPRWALISLAILLVGLLGLWRPWELNKRTIEVSGQAEIKAAPDQFTFSPTYSKTADSSEGAIAEVTAIGNGVVAKLKELGVSDNSITTNINSSRSYKSPDAPTIEPSPPISTDENTAQYSITVVVTDKELSQKIADYIVTTPVQYAVTPQYSFSTNKRNELESQARVLALADARKKAEATASTLDVKLGKVQKVSEIQWGGIYPTMSEGRGVTTDAVSPIILPGEQPVTFTVTVTYQLK